jgi:hypothetical protein
VQEGAAYLNDFFLNHTFVPWWPNRQWVDVKRENNFGFTYYGEGKLDYDRRGGSFALWATWAPKRMGDPNKLPASYYLKNFRDGSGETFRGENLYRLRVPADTPAHDFWSIIAYEIGTNAFIHNPENRVGVSSYDKTKMAVNEDGSVDVYIGPTSPEGLKNNWIPTSGKDFWLVARFYGPQKALFDKTWVMPDVEKVR